MSLYRSARGRRVGAMFGVVPGGEAGSQKLVVGSWKGEENAGVGGMIAWGGITLITGASGSGKSTLLRRVEWELRGRGGVMRLERIGLPERAVVDCFCMPLEETLGLLAGAGLGEAGLWLRRPRELSEGERFRFRLARWMAQGRRRVLIADEFGNSLDRETARGLAWRLRRFVARAGGERTAILATAHEDLAGDLGAALHVRLT